MLRKNSMMFTLLLSKRYKTKENKSTHRTKSGRVQKGREHADIIMCRNFFSCPSLHNLKQKNYINDHNLRVNNIPN